MAAPSLPIEQIVAMLDDLAPAAGSLGDALDAIHLAAALALHSDLAGIVTYDDRLAAVAATHRLRVEHPGSDQ